MTETAENYGKNRNNYIIMLGLSAVFLVLALHSDNHENLMIAVPTLILSTIGLQRKEQLVLPPLFIVMTAVSMVLIQLTNYFRTDFYSLTVASNIFFGIYTCILGLMIVMALLSSSPNFDLEKPFFVSFTAFCISVSLSVFLLLGGYFVDFSYSHRDTGFADFVSDMVSTMCGSLLVSVLFYMNRHNGLFEHTLNKFISRNADILGVAEEEKNRALAEIEKGESSRLEFKSTLRTNLKTGEKDPRMERAVLKTIVAYLNSRGGTLFIGVADDGTVLGIDTESFDNSKDKFGLHLNNLIVRQIGGEFLPFIRYNLIDFDDRSIMKVECQRSNRPVFLNDGKEEIFYVRSGPSTIELHGMELLYYTNHNFGKSLKKKL